MSTPAWTPDPTAPDPTPPGCDTSPSATARMFPAELEAFLTDAVNRENLLTAYAADPAAWFAADPRTTTPHWICRLPPQPLRVHLDQVGADPTARPAARHPHSRKRSQQSEPGAHDSSPLQCPCCSWITSPSSSRQPIGKHSISASCPQTTKDLQSVARPVQQQAHSSLRFRDVQERPPITCTGDCARTPASPPRLRTS